MGLLDLRNYKMIHLYEILYSIYGTKLYQYH
ncbi:hypothetical protein J2S16_003226 [Cytobacillus kochii]|nr:hypothetical protein [Cytobacillus kochii]